RGGIPPPHGRHPRQERRRRHGTRDLRAREADAFLSGLAVRNGPRRAHREGRREGTRVGERRPARAGADVPLAVRLCGLPRKTRGDDALARVAYPLQHAAEREDRVQLRFVVDVPPREDRDELDPRHHEEKLSSVAPRGVRLLAAYRRLRHDPPLIAVAVLLFRLYARLRRFGRPARGQHARATPDAVVHVEVAELREVTGLQVEAPLRIREALRRPLPVVLDAERREQVLLRVLIRGLARRL